jgi:SRSO17 transposase
VENCQVGVFLTYVTARGHTLIDRELYLPLDWCEDRERCRAAHIPESVRFQTKPELAIQMLGRMQEAGCPIAWVVADTVYGGNLDLRTWLQAHGYPYVLAVACDEPVGIVTPDGQRRLVEVRDVEALVLQEQDWQRLAMREGTKGPRLFDWACVPILHRWEDDGRHWLLLRRSLTDPREKAYSFVFAPQGTTLCEMVQASGARWHIEEDFANTKDLGLDHYEVRSCVGWYRHITLVLLALAYLAGICAMDRCCTIAPTTSRSASTAAVLALTVPEVRHLLARLIWPASSSARRVLAWSGWRRAHQSHASYFHTKRRLKAG